VANGGLSVQAFKTKRGKVLLTINKRNRTEQVMLPAEAAGATLWVVAPSTKDHAAAERKLEGRVLELEPFEVAVVQYK